MAKTIKILYVCGGVLDRGGITSYLMNYYRVFDKNILKIDFLVQGDGRNLYENEIIENDGQIIKIKNKSRNFINNIFGMYTCMIKGNYDIVHAHADAANGLILMIAKFAGIKIRISHSHSTNFYTSNKIKAFFNILQKKMIKLFANELWGCSKLSCEWLYGKNSRSTVIHNAIDIEKFRFNIEKRKFIRKKLQVDDNTLLIGQIGHISYIKNQLFTLKISQILNNITRNFDFKIIIIGSGSDLYKLEKYTIDNKIENKVVFFGERDDIDSLMQGLDIMLLPSIFEGFPVTLVEAQASGLNCLVSSNVSDEVDIGCNLVDFMSIDEENIMEWVNYIVKFKDKHIIRETKDNLICQAGFNIEFEGKKLQNMYLNLVEDGELK